MKWFQHDSNASTDAKIKKLLLKNGAEGYAVYFHCLELIAGSVEKNNITFELEHDTEIIADNLKIKGDNDYSAIDKVNNIMKNIIELGLFECSNSKITCLKLALRLDNTVSRSPGFNQIKKNVSSTKLLRSGNVADEIDKKEENKGDEKKLDPTQNYFNKWLSMENTKYTIYTLPPGNERNRLFSDFIKSRYYKDNKKSIEAV